MNGRQLGLLAAMVFAIGSPIVQTLGEVGLSPAEFAREGDRTLRAAGYAFSIWGVIYAGLAAFAVYQALPRNRDDALLRRIAGPAFVAIAGTGAWIWASMFDARWASVGIIVVSAAVLTAGLIRAAGARAAHGLAVRAFVWWPLSLLAGWLTIASALNILTVATAEGLIDGAERAAAYAGVAVVLVVTLLVLRASRLAAYAIPIAWGLVAVWVAEQAAKPTVALVALAAAGVIGAYAVWLALRPAVKP